jgi:putative MATE family efflux protein
MPAVGEQILTLLVNLVNTILVGHLGAAALTAVGLSGTISMIASSFYSAVATGGTALVARSVGARDHATATRAAEQAVMVALGLGVASMAVLLPLVRQTLLLMGAEPEAVAQGMRYLPFLAATMPFMALLLVGNAVLRGSGDTRTPMFIMSGMNAVNLSVSYLLIRGVGPLPELGVMGAGIAVGTVRVLGGLAVLTVLLRGYSRIRIRRLFNRLDMTILRRLLQIGLPAGGEIMLMRVAFLAYTRSIASLGTVAYAAYIITQRVEQFSSMPAMGFAAASTTLCGQALGAGEPDKARASVFRAIEIAGTYSLLMASITFLFPETMLRIFTNDAAVIAKGIMPLRLVALVQPFMAISFSLSGALRGAGDTRATMLVTGIGAWFVRVPVAILSVTVLGWGLSGVQASMTLDWLSRLIMYSWRFRPRGWQRGTEALTNKTSLTS